MKTCFLKFSEKKEYLLDFVEKGHVYINNVEYFIKHEENGYKYDNHELASSYHQHVGASITIAGRKFKIAKPFSMRHGDVNFTHIYCLYTLSDESIKKTMGNNVFSEDLWHDFGNYFVLIHDADKFLNRLLSKLKKMNFGYRTDCVSYFCPDTYDGLVGAFKKRNIYEYQNEFRVAVSAPIDGPIEDLYIGDLTDITAGPVHKNKSNNNVVEDRANL
jgi:hypothetical protein